MENIKQSTRDNPSRCFDLPENIWSGVLNFNEFLWCIVVEYVVVVCCLVLHSNDRHLHISRRRAEWGQPCSYAYKILQRVQPSDTERYRTAYCNAHIPTFRYKGRLYVPNTIPETVHNKLLYYKYLEEVRKIRCPRYTLHRSRLMPSIQQSRVFFMKTNPKNIFTINKIFLI